MNIRFAQVILFLTILIAPLYIIRSYFILPGLEFFVPFTLLEIFILFSIGITGLVYLKGKYPVTDFKTSLDPFIGLFLGASILAVITSYDVIGGLGILKAYIIEPIIFYYLLIFVSKHKGYQFIIMSLIGAGIWLCLLGLLQNFFGVFIFAKVEYEQNRITSVYNSANSLALFLGPLVLLVFSQFYSLDYKKYLRFVYLGFFVMFIFIMYFTRSRGGLISLAGALAVFIFGYMTIKYHFIRRFWVVVPTTVAICLIAFFGFLYENYDFFPINYSVPYTAGDTLQIRYFIWAGTINMLKEHFVFGAGLNGFKTLYSNQYRPVQYQEQFQYPHNILLTFWTEMGIFGLFSFLLLIVSLYSILIRNLIKNKRPILGVALLGVLSYWMLHGMVDVPYFKNDLSLEFWTIAALIESWRLRG